MRRLIASASLFVLAAVAAPAVVQAAPAAAVTGEALVPVNMKVDAGYLTAEERKVVNLLIQAADQMTAIYDRQSAGTSPGRGFYPADLTRAEFDAYLAAHPDQKAALTDAYTVVKRDGDKLAAVPYSVEYKAELDKAAALLDQAAAITTNPSLKTFLTLRAASFRSNDYFKSEMAWMDLENTPIEVAIGPYEVYTDALYGAKAAFEAFVTLKDPKASADLPRFKSRLRDMEANLPVEERYKNFQRGGASPIVVADQVRGGGDNLHGPQTVAFNLPNDERVREAKGAKKVILANVLGAKYDRILKPIGDRALVPDQAAKVSKKYMTMETLFHELSHSLGPGSITVDGRATTVGAELTDLYSMSEEAKADVMGAYNVLYMMDLGELPKAEREQFLDTYLAGIFRAARFGADEAHGRGAALQYGYLKAKGAFSWDDKAKRFRVNYPKMSAGIRDLTADLVRLQGDGDRAGMAAFFDKYAHLDAHADAVVATLKDIPVDIQPIYPNAL